MASRTERASLRQIGLTTNPLLLWGIAFELVFAAVVVVVEPLQRVFGTAVPAWWQVAMLAPFPHRPPAVDELWRWRRRRGPLCLSLEGLLWTLPVPQPRRQAESKQLEGGVMSKLHVTPSRTAKSPRPPTGHSDWPNRRRSSSAASSGSGSSASPVRTRVVRPDQPRSDGVSQPWEHSRSR